MNQNLLQSILALTSSSPFGVGLEGRSWSAESGYRYGFQAQEQDAELWEGAVNYKYRVEDPRLGRFFSVDPLNAKYPFYSSYQFSGNRLIDSVELEGLEPGSYEEKHPGRVLVIVVQGYEGKDPPLLKTQVKNNPFAKDDPGDLNKISDIEELNDQMFDVFQFSSADSERTKDDVKETISNFMNVDPFGRIILIGHSLGADNLIEIVNENSQINVDLLITLDICDGLDIDDDNIPPNVAQAINYYQDLGWTEYGGELVEPADGNKTSDILNIPVKYSHKQIDEKLADECILLIREKANGKDWKAK